MPSHRSRLSRDTCPKLLNVMKDSGRWNIDGAGMHCARYVSSSLRCAAYFTHVLLLQCLCDHRGAGSRDTPPLICAVRTRPSVSIVRRLLSVNTNAVFQFKFDPHNVCGAHGRAVYGLVWQTFLKSFACTCFLTNPAPPNLVLAALAMRERTHNWNISVNSRSLHT